MSLPLKNKSENKKGENTSEIPTKKGKKDETPLMRNKKNQKQEEGEIMSGEEDE